ncbi:monofunctional biosynthetic peptidoglycan transglycosylase [Paraflavitalea pollutisoli]|uniref:monofunctional biosynthetic peptidoglycan transglycosylase n=1 Tax=Paraflavitalea pollutisoli TaxID=3034143 RepID=UPI0023EAE09E|nr:monofunctional biosynthetic peptidoglycan transglycosylase [Paraflavitalea sp. H1-2-19X]
MAIKTKGLGLRVWRILKRIILFLFIFQLFYILLLKWVDPPVTITQLGSWVTGNGLKRDYVSFKEMSPYARLAVICSEDQLFPDHNGFDWKNIEKAMKNNEKRPNRIKGASTISQQVAKNVFLWQGRSWFRKGLEMYFTFMIELIWGKKRILEVYLNVAEMGKGVFGIEAAAQAYFKKPAKKLTRQEAAMIAACLPNPKVYTVKPLSAFVANKYPWVLRQMNNLQEDEEIQPLLQ